MFFPDSDKYLLAAICFGLSAAYVIIPKWLQEVKDAAGSPSPDMTRKYKKLDRDTENELKLGTLQNLAEGHIFELRNSAIKIIASRTVKSSTRRLLLRDLASEDEDCREDAINGLWLLIYIPDFNQREMPSYFIDYDTFHALITALVNVIPLHKRSTAGGNRETSSIPEIPPSPIRPLRRPAHEVSLMVMLTYLLHYMKRSSVLESAQQRNLELALSAGLVTRWLAFYPFPCALLENSRFNYKKSDVVSLFDTSAWGNDDPLMYEIMRRLTRSAQALKQLRDAGLRSSRYTEDVESTDLEMPGWRPRYQVAEPSDTASEFLGFTSEESGLPRPRSLERSQEEESLRRRHREAIVVAERGIPLSRENILQRENSRVPLGPLPTISDEEYILDLEESAPAPDVPRHYPP